MTLRFDQIRSLRGQVVATALLFVFSLPIAVGVVFARPYFEKYLEEKYAPVDQQFEKRLRPLIDSLEQDRRDGKGLDEEQLRQRDLDLQSCKLEDKRRIYEDWVQRHAPGRLRTVRKLAELDPDNFLAWAEQSVICGNALQRRAGLAFLVSSEHPASAGKLDRLAAWARRRHLSDVAGEVDSARSR